MKKVVLGNKVMEVPAIAVGCMRLADKNKEEM